MNEDHADALELYATALCGASGSGWRMTGIDPEGFDIVRDGEARRILFAERTVTPRKPPGRSWCGLPLRRARAPRLSAPFLGGPLP